MSKDKSVLKNAQKLGRAQQKSITGDAVNGMSKQEDALSGLILYAHNKKKPPHKHP